MGTDRVAYIACQSSLNFIKCVVTSSVVYMSIGEAPAEFDLQGCQGQRVDHGVTYQIPQDYRWTRWPGRITSGP